MFNSRVHIGSKVFKGALSELAVFILAQIIMFEFRKIMPMPMMEGSLGLTMVGSLIGHLVFGIAVALIVRNYAVELTNNIHFAHA